MKKNGTFFTCTRCGLSFKPWEIDQAKDRARAEVRQFASVSEEKREEQSKRRKRNYKRWIEGSLDDE